MSGRVRRRGDDIPTVSAYAHWNEDAEAMWYAENRYDMEHADEIIEDDDDRSYDEPEPFEEAFGMEDEARAFAATLPDTPRVSEWNGTWYVEHYDKAAHDKRRAH